MKNIIIENSFFAIGLTLLTYLLINKLKKKYSFALLNPMLLSIIVIIIFLHVMKIDYSWYDKNTMFIDRMLTPTTICLAIPLYKQRKLLVENILPIISGILVGILANIVCLLIIEKIFNLSDVQYATLLPKSITTAIAIGIAPKINGIIPITISAIVLTGVTGNVLAEWVFKIFKIKNPIAKGIALGTASHAVGTAKAIELGKIEGAMSSLSVVLTGIMTTVIIFIMM